jgi:hypothetical protein
LYKVFYGLKIDLMLVRSKMKNAIDILFESIIQQYGNEAARLIINGKKMIVIDSPKNTKVKIPTIPLKLMQIFLLFPPDTAIPVKKVFIESDNLLTADLATQIRNTVVPWYRGRMLVEGSRPGDSGGSGLPGSVRLFFIGEDGIAEETQIAAL